MTQHTPTPEQAEIVAAFETERDLVIQAGAQAQLALAGEG